MMTFDQFKPLRSKSSSKNISCYEAYCRGYKEAQKKYEDKLKQLDQELKIKTKPWVTQED